MDAVTDDMDSSSVATAPTASSIGSATILVSPTPGDSAAAATAAEPATAAAAVKGRDGNHGLPRKDGVPLTAAPLDVEGDVVADSTRDSTRDAAAATAAAAAAALVGEQTEEEEGEEEAEATAGIGERRTAKEAGLLV